MASITPTELLSAIDDGACAGMTITSTLAPMEGRHTPVCPAIHSGGVYQWQRRFDDDSTQQPCIEIDSVQSQANRMQRALAELEGYPMLEFSLAGSNLPPHLPTKITSLELPHRHADAYLRDSEVNAVAFDKTPLGEALVKATGVDPGALVGWFPHSLYLGFWQSHRGKQTAAKHPRAWQSSIIGWNPAVEQSEIEGADRRFERRGTKGDPLNLAADAKGDKGKKLSEEGHGQVPFGGKGTSEERRGPQPVSFERIVQQASLSFPILRQVATRPTTAAPDPVHTRVLSALLALWSFRIKFGQPFVLRTGTTLEPDDIPIVVLGGQRIELPKIDDLTQMVHDTAKLACAGMSKELNGWQRDPLHLEPNKKLQDYIAKTWPTDE